MKQLGWLTIHGTSCFLTLSGSWLVRIVPAEKTPENERIRPLQKRAMFYWKCHLPTHHFQATFVSFQGSKRGLVPSSHWDTPTRFTNLGYTPVPTWQFCKRGLFWDSENVTRNFRLVADLQFFWGIKLDHELKHLLNISPLNGMITPNKNPLFLGVY